MARLVLQPNLGSAAGDVFGTDQPAALLLDTDDDSGETLASVPLPVTCGISREGWASAPPLVVFGTG